MNQGPLWEQAKAAVVVAKAETAIAKQDAQVERDKASTAYSEGYKDGQAHAIREAAKRGKS